MTKQKVKYDFGSTSLTNLLQSLISIKFSSTMPGPRTKLGESLVLGSTYYFHSFHFTSRNWFKLQSCLRTKLLIYFLILALQIGASLQLGPRTKLKLKEDTMLLAYTLMPIFFQYSVYCLVLGPSSYLVSFRSTARAYCKLQLGPRTKQKIKDHFWMHLIKCCTLEFDF